MGRGNPNDKDPSKKLNFVAKVWDEKANGGSGAYRPIYIPPDATETVSGDVYLSDQIDGTATAATSDTTIRDAATGVTAATPAAVKKVNDNANTKVSKTDTAAQTMASSLSPNVNNTLSLGTSSLKWANIYATTVHAALDGNATTASKLNHNITFSLKSGSANSTSTVVSNLEGNTLQIPINALDASTLTTGTVPLARLPQGALERLVHVADQTARFKLTTDNVQLGDTVQQDDTGVMYVVVDESKLNSAAGYQEYAAGTAITAQTADTLSQTLIVGKGGTGTTSLTSNQVVLGNGSSALKTTAASGVGALYRTSTTGAPTFGTLPIANGGTGKTAALDAITALGAESIASVGVKIPDNSDLNSYTTPGTFYVPSATNAQTIQHTPTTSSGYKLIVKQPYSTTRLVQEAQYADTVRENIWQRTSGDSGTTWSDWKKIIKDSVALGSQVSGTLPIANGGTNATNADTAWTNLGGGSVGKLNTNGSTTQFLRGDGTWQSVSTEDNKTAQTNSTANTAYPILLKNGTGTGTVTNGVLFASGITINPSTSTITATNFAGKATSAGTADTATSAATWTTGRTISLTGNVTGSVSNVNGGGNISIATTLADGTVSTGKIVNNAVTLGKLATAVETVHVGTDQPTDSHVVIWIDTN